jgi:hypothetical protein
MAFKLTPVSASELKDLLTQGAARGRSSKGGALIKEFITSGEVAATVQLGSTKERNAVALSASNHTRRTGAQVWVRKAGGGTGTELLLVNLAKADAATRKAYETRPRVGRRPANG